ncbi:hypothetical protein HNV11_23190 [Spirosoma taeanense]|uniref:Uncharacterized protein n=1 Tax=Spirosoma taeanense TaxID=2735870 RepID=A0A6M5YGN9_9BACT|nr:hypothetical protein [Spirosoma taeanense]QJW92072.1 hypothetical protein HNV11_23190 [Spirosoma taeanense]
MQLTAGSIQLQYENGFLRTLTANSEESLRMIYFALRDRDWNTARMRITNESVQTDTDAFLIRYDWQIDDLGIQISGNVHIQGNSQGEISFGFYGKAINTFYRNRLGFCILHPVDGLAGQACRIEHPDGQTTESIFPEFIDPYQPFLDIQAMVWTMASGQQFRLDFDGDIFETEDQRNWSDTSYKTYCTPLERPFPVEVLAGTEVWQRVTFRPVFIQTLAQMHPRNVTSQTEVSPRIGLGYPADGRPLLQQEVDKLKALNLSHLRADVFMAQDDWQNKLIAAWHDADRLNVSLEIALFFGAHTPTEAHQITDFIRQQALRVHSLLLFQADIWRTTDELLNQVTPIFRQQLPDVQLGGGTDAYFVELNRHRFDFKQIDFVTYSINPQVHAFDDQTLLENIAAQGDTVRSARTLSGGKPVHISTVTLLPRFNPDATSGSGRGVLPADPRQMTSFGAEWTRQSLETLTKAGAASITYFETHGPRGLLDEDAIFPVLNTFRNC